MSDGKATLTRSGFRPDQEAQIAEQYTAGGTLTNLARAWHCSTERIRAALVATGTALRNRGGQAGHEPTYHAGRFARTPELDARDARILELARAGWSNPELANEFGLAYARICQILAGADIPIRQERAAATDAAIERAIVDRYQAGESAARIARDLGIGHPRIIRTLEAAGIERRGTLQAPGRPPAQRRPAIRRAEGVITATRTCHACDGIKIPVEDWSKHLTEVHGYNGKAGKARTALDRYIANLPPPTEPARIEAPPCPICKGRCAAPTSHGRIIRARQQHAARLARETDKKAA